MSDQHHLPEELSGRVKDIKKELKEQFLSIEQEPPRKPSFLLVVILFGIVIIVIFILAIIVLHLNGSHFGRHSFRKNPVSQLVLPLLAPSQLPSLTHATPGFVKGTA